jgi:hypothetical protein
MCSPGQSGDETLQHLARGTVAVVPHHLQHAVAAVPVGQQARDILSRDVDVAFRRHGLCHHVAGLCLPAQRTDLLAEERFSCEHHLEAVVVGRIVTAGHHHRAVGPERGRGIIQHRRRTASDAHRLDAAGTKTFDEGRFHLGARQPPIEADRDGDAALARHDRTETAADGEGIVLEQRAADRAADVILAQSGRIETVGERHGQTRSRATAFTMKSAGST